VNCLLFADDLKIWSSNDPDGLQMDIDTVKRWSKDWGLPINDLKCAHMSFGGESGNGFYILEEDPPAVIPKACFKRDLGVLLSESFSYTAHHEQVARKAFGVLRMIQRSFPRIARHDFQVLYGTYIRPCLEYANQVVASGLVKDANILERVQRKATKIVRGLHDLPYEQRLQILDLFPLETRRIRGDLIFTFSLFKNGSASELFQLILPQSNMILRGHQKKIYKKRPRTYIRQHFFSFRVVNYWNALTSVVVYASSKDLFKKGIDNWLKSEHPRKGLT
jgi:ribonuclease P/MRP protein subunit RPP40